MQWDLLHGNLNSSLHGFFRLISFQKVEDREEEHGRYHMRISSNVNNETMKSICK